MKNKKKNKNNKFHPKELKDPSGFSRREEAVFPDTLLFFSIHSGHSILLLGSFWWSVLYWYAYPEKALPISTATTTRGSPHAIGLDVFFAFVKNNVVVRSSIMKQIHMFDSIGGFFLAWICLFLFVWSLTSHSRIFHSYGDVIITGEGL